MQQGADPSSCSGTKSALPFHSRAPGAAHYWVGLIATKTRDRSNRHVTCTWLTVLTERWLWQAYPVLECASEGRGHVQQLGLIVVMLQGCAAGCRHPQGPAGSP